MHTAIAQAQIEDDIAWFDGFQDRTQKAVGAVLIDQHTAMVFEDLEGFIVIHVRSVNHPSWFPLAGLRNENITD
jgi:hypothetical protein